MYMMGHHYFLNPFIIFPLLLIGCEQYFRKKRPGLFLVMVFVAAVSNFYFFYMMVIMTVLYAVWRSVRRNGVRQFGRVLLDGAAFLWYGLIGTLMASVVFLPVVLRFFLQDPRTADNKSVPLLWPLRYYRNFLDCFLTNGTSALSESWTYMGFGAVALLGVIYIFVNRKRHFDLKAAFIGLTCLLMTPLAGFVLNGFSYPANRWMWAYALLVAFMTATAVSEMTESGTGTTGVIIMTAFVLAVCICVCVFWEYTFSRASAQAVVIALFGLAAVLAGRAVLLERVVKRRQSDAGTDDSETAQESLGAVKRKITVRVQAVLLACVLLTAASAGYFDFSAKRSAKIFEYLSRAQVETQTAKDAAAAAQLIDGNLLKSEFDTAEKTGSPKPFYRYTTYNPENNTSLLYGVSNTQYYWSLSNPNSAQFFSETGQLNRMIHQYDNLDDRTFLNEIAGVRYFLGNDQEGVPFGYVKKEGLSYSNEDLWKDTDNLDRYSCEIYENQYALPIGFTSDKWLSRKDYEAMDIPQRQQALMQGILLEEDPGESFKKLGTTQTPVAFNDVRLPVTISCGEKEFAAGEKLVFDGSEGEEGGSVVTIRFNGQTDCETCLYIRGLEYQPPEGRAGTTKFLLPVTGYRGDQSVVSKQIGFTTPMDPWTTGRKDFLVNMRYSIGALDRIDLSLPSEGTFTVDSIEVVCQPMTAFQAQAEAFRAHSMTDLDIHEMGRSGATERITGHIEMDAPGILCLQIPRSAGWTAYVDGEKTRILQADTMFSALLLPSGSHNIELRWQTPGLRLGAVISAGVFFLLVLFLLLYTILSAIFHAAERRKERIPKGYYSEVKTGQETVKNEEPIKNEGPIKNEKPEKNEGPVTK